MTNHKIDIELDGNTLTLAFDFNAFSLLEEEFGKSMSEIKDGEIFDTSSAKALIRFLFVFSKSYHPEITKEEIGRMIHIGNANEIVEKVREKYEQSMPEPQEKKAQKEKANANHSP